MQTMRCFNMKTDLWKGVLEYDKRKEVRYMCCPYCGKRNFPVNHGARVFNLVYKCRGSNCKREFLVNIKSCEAGGTKHE